MWKVREGTKAGERGGVNSRRDHREGGLQGGRDQGQRWRMRERAAAPLLTRQDCEQPSRLRTVLEEFRVWAGWKRARRPSQASACLLSIQFSKVFNFRALLGLQQN